MTLLKNVGEKINKNQTEMFMSLSDLISIPSVVSDASGDKPFGEKVHEAFKYMLDMAEKEGFGVIASIWLLSEIAFLA